MFKALLLTMHEHPDTQPSLSADITSVPETDLPAGDVLINVEYSSLNYKDGLAITGIGKIVRHYPMIPGIDFSGVISKSDDPRFKAGERVILTGWGVGEGYWGGLAEKARVKGDWLVHAPENLNSRQAMAIGTAGLTAWLCVDALQAIGCHPDDGDILVTGASGGVGSTAVYLLSKLGYSVVAMTGRASNIPYLKQLGASRCVMREDYEGKSRPLEKQFWAGAVDTVGGDILAKVLAEIHYNGPVAACGLASDFRLNTTVMPFILRGVKLLGIDSVQCPQEQRQRGWQALSELLDDDFYQLVGSEIELDQAIEYAQKLMDGTVTGRTLVKIS